MAANKFEYKFNGNDLTYKTIALLLMAALRQDETGFERLAACLRMEEVEYVCNGKHQPVNGVRLMDEPSLIAQVGPLYKMDVDTYNDIDNQHLVITGFKSEDEYKELKGDKPYTPSPSLKYTVPISVAVDYGFDTF